MNFAILYNDNIDSFIEFAHVHELASTHTYTHTVTNVGLGCKRGYNYFLLLVPGVCALP